jgi:general L-amino acid transport system permease protein
MSIEPRPPPPQFVAKLRRALGGRAGWGGFFVQILFVAVLAWIGYEIVANVRANLQAQRITSGFGFLNNTAGFDVSQNLIPYSGSDTYSRVFLVGLVNTLVVAILCDHHRIYRGAGPAVAELAAVAHFRRLCRTDP